MPTRPGRRRRCRGALGVALHGRPAGQGGVPEHDDRERRNERGERDQRREAGALKNSVYRRHEKHRGDEKHQKLGNADAEEHALSLCYPRFVRTAVILALLALGAAAPPPTTCGRSDDYAAALCAYQRRNFAEAAAGFRAIVEQNADDPQTVRAMYFLARTEMKVGRFDEAQALLIRIYALDAPFYRTWSCDFLLGECRRGAGK